MTPPRILIIGAGYTGIRLAERLQASGQAKVFLFSRSEVKAPEGVTFIQGNISDPDDLKRIPQRISAVAFCVAASRNAPTSYEDVFVHGQQNLIDLFSERGDPIKRYLMMSTTGVYGDAEGDWIDETTPVAPNHPGTKQIVKGENLLLQSAIPATVVRFSGIYGPNRQRLIRAVQTNAAYILPGDPVYLNQIHITDILAVLAHLLFLSDAQSVYVASDMEPATRGSVLQWIADKLNKNAPIEDANKAPQPRHGNKRCRSQQLVDSGFTFTYPTFRQGYGALITEGHSNDGT